MQSLTDAVASAPPPFLFATMAMVPLLAPGPTNTLHFAASAKEELSASLRLVSAELFGYLVAIHGLAFSIGTFLLASRAAQIGARAIITLYLLWLASKLLTRETSVQRQSIITPERVFVTTLLNPKAAVFAFIVLPPMTGGHWLSAVPYLLGLSVLIVVASVSWISLGAAIGNGRIAVISPRVIQSVASVLMIVFVALINIYPTLTVR